MNYPAMYRAVVVDNADPKGLSRVRLRMPQILGESATGWAYPLGTGSVPDVGTSVWATFEGGDVSFPAYMPATSPAGHTHSESDVTSLVNDLASLQSSVSSLTTSKANLSGAAFTGNVSTSGTISASGLAGSLLSAANPLVNGTAAAGTSAIPSRQDHVHPTDTSRAQDSLVVHLSGTETITGAKTFQSTLTALGSVDTTPELVVRSDIYRLWLHGGMNAGAYNPAVQLNDSGIIFTTGTSSTGALVIGPWSDTAYGLRIDSSGVVKQRNANVPVVTVSGTAPSSPVTGDIWIDSSDAWTSYTPTVGGWVNGNGTTTGYYTQRGRTVHFRARFTLGTSFSSSTALTMTFPTAINLGGPGHVFPAFGNPGGAYYSLNARVSSSTQFEIYYAGTNGAINNITTTAPAAWASTNFIEVSGTYEAASSVGGETAKIWNGSAWVRA